MARKKKKPPETLPKPVEVVLADELIIAANNILAAAGIDATEQRILGLAHVLRDAFDDWVHDECEREAEQQHIRRLNQTDPDLN